VNCTHCGTALPVGALFCGECGRSAAVAKPAVHGVSATKAESLHRTVARQSTPARWVEDPVTGSSLIDDEPEEIDVEVGPDEARCEQCQSVMGLDDIFCGECGFVSRSITRAFSADFTGETRQIDLSPPAASVAPPVAEVPVKPVAPATPPAPQAPPVVPAPPAPRPPSPRSFLEDDDDDDLDDVEATRIVNRLSGNRFVLQFSTGESFTVHGAGLIGRNPQPEPGEFFDHLVRVLDSGKSVSKTHLEFGQESGAFWLKDRFSGNGTIIREPDISARRAEPDRRYRVVRGTRIDIGEQFFVIS
jgi:hypothetical protein